MVLLCALTTQTILMAEWGHKCVKSSIGCIEHSCVGCTEHILIFLMIRYMKKKWTGKTRNGKKVVNRYSEDTKSY